MQGGHERKPSTKRQGARIPEPGGQGAIKVTVGPAAVVPEKTAMRTPRLKPPQATLYHLYSRLVHGVWLTDRQKARFRQMAAGQTAFCGVDLVTFTVMGNHFHLIVHVAERHWVSDEQMLKRVKGFYGAKSSRARLLAKELQEKGHLSRQSREGYEARMGDVSVLMKELKQRFTIWYNAEQQRYGTLWAERFKSTLLGKDLESVLRGICYVDLNAVRAGMVEDPLDYRFCGYAEAVATNGPVRQMLVRVLGCKDWKEAGKRYRMALFGEAGTPRHSGKAVLDPELVRQELRKGGKVEHWKTGYVRCRYFVCGLGVGSEEYLNEIHEMFRDYFGRKRKKGAHKLKGGDWGNLRVFRDLQKDVFGKEEK